MIDYHNLSWLKILEHIAAVCPGWSEVAHWQVFLDLIKEYRIHDVLVCGVYQGRDIAVLSSIFQAAGLKDYRIVGVDLFSDEPGDDWAPEDREKTWEEVVNMPAPSLKGAQENLGLLGMHDNVTLVQSRDIDFLNTTQGKFDFIYLDTAHDYKTVYNSIQASRHLLKGPALIGGDDYEFEDLEGNPEDISPDMWGVKKAVEDSFSVHQNHNRVWVSKLAWYKEEESNNA